MTNRIMWGRHRRSIRTALPALLCAVGLALAPLSAVAESDAADMAKEGGIGAAAALTSLLYAPAKLLYATGGLIVGGMAWAFSGGDNVVAKTVFTPAARGDYVITPAHLRGERPVEFIGREPEYRDYAADATDVAAAPETYSSPDGW